MVVRALAILLLLTVPATADDAKPSATFCWLAKTFRERFLTDKAAEEAAVARGASQATIAKAKRCKP